MAAPTVLFLNGPNANLYGLDAKGPYGTESFPEIEARCRKHAGALGLDLNFRQSNVAPSRPRRRCMKRDALIFCSAFDDADAWNETLTAELPDLEFRTDPAAGDPAAVRYALVWKPPAGILRQISKSGIGDQPGSRRRLAGRT
jgi:hypothetical protein